MELRACPLDTLMMRCGADDLIGVGLTARGAAPAGDRWWSSSRRCVRNSTAAVDLALDQKWRRLPRNAVRRPLYGGRGSARKLPTHRDCRGKSHDEAAAKIATHASAMVTSGRRTRRTSRAEHQPTAIKVDARAHVVGLGRTHGGAPDNCLYAQKLSEAGSHADRWSVAL